MASAEAPYAPASQLGSDQRKRPNCVRVYIPIGASPTAYEPRVS